MKKALLIFFFIFFILLAVAYDSNDFSYILMMIPGTSDFKATWLALWVIVASGISWLTASKTGATDHSGAQKSNKVGWLGVLLGAMAYQKSGQDGDVRVPAVWLAPESTTEGEFLSAVRISDKEWKIVVRTRAAGTKNFITYQTTVLQGHGAGGRVSCGNALFCIDWH